MKRARGKLTYGNVVATVALFLALTGGVVWAAHKIRSAQIARNAVKARNIARGAVTSSKVKNGSLQRVDLAGGTLSGLPIADSSASNIAVPLSGTSPSPIALQGTTSFVARKGRAGISETTVAGDPKELLTEARGTLTSGGAQPCDPVVEVDLNGLQVATLTPSTDDPVAGAAVAAGLTQPGHTQTITAKVFPDGDCAAGAKIDQLRVVVVQYG